MLSVFRNAGLIATRTGWQDLQAKFMMMRRNSILRGAISQFVIQPWCLIFNRDASVFDLWHVDTIMMLDIIKREYMYTIWRKNVLNTERKQTHFVWPIFCSCATLPSIWATYFPIPITWSHQGPQKNLILAKYDSSIINCEQCYCPLFATGGHWP